MAIIKIRTRKSRSFSQALAYVSRNKSSRDKDIWFEIKHNVFSETHQELAREFLNNDEKRDVRRSDSNVLGHEIISFGPEDSRYLNREKLIEMAQKYISLRNPKGLYYIVPHLEEHIHLHVICGATDTQGKSLRMSKDELSTLREQFQDYHLKRFPELKHSSVRTGKDAVRNKETELKQFLKEVLKGDSTRESLQEKLAEKGMSFYERNGRLTGVKWGKKYRFKTLGIETDRIQDPPESPSDEKVKNRLVELRENSNEQSLDKESDKE